MRVVTLALSNTIWTWATLSSIHFLVQQCLQFCTDQKHVTPLHHDMGQWSMEKVKTIMEAVENLKKINKNQMIPFPFLIFR